MSFQDIQNSTPSGVKMINGNYLEQHLPELEGLLSPDDARASRLDPIAFVEFLRELNQRGWWDDLHCAFILYRSDDPRQTPVALAMATKKQYRDGIRRPVELDWDSTNRYRAIDNHWCLEYHRGTGAGCFVLARLLHHLAHQLQQAMIWLIVAGGFKNRRALTLYSQAGFTVTSLDFEKTPVMSTFIGQDLGRRAQKY